MNNKLATETCVDYKINSKANEINDRIDNQAWTLYGVEDIPSSSDLNNYKECGNYRVVANSIAQTLTNCPVTSAFMLKVYDGTGNGRTTGWCYRTQRLEAFTGFTFIRTGNSSNGGGLTDIVWGAWTCIPRADDFRMVSGTSGTINMNQNTGQYVEVPITIPSGLMAICISSISSNGFLVMTYSGDNPFGRTGSTNVGIWAYNQNTTAVNNVSFTVHVLCMRK